MSKEPIQFPAIVSGVRSLKDQTLKITLETNEMPPESTAQVFDIANDQVWAALKETAVSEDDIEVPELLPDLKSEQKSLSERLRNVMYVYYEKMNDTEVGFEKWRSTKMEQFIAKYKEKIRELEDNQD